MTDQPDLSKARVPGTPPPDQWPQVDPVTEARLWRNPCWFAFRFNYLAKTYNAPLYGWIEQRYGLSRPEYNVIYSLGLRDGVTARDVSISYGYPKNTLSRCIQRLVKLGLISRTADENDRRSFILTLTKEGRALFDETLQAFVDKQDQMLKGLSPAEREHLSVLLAKIVLDTLPWASAEVHPRLSRMI